jgi:hypothetical protein
VGDVPGVRVPDEPADAGCVVDVQPVGEELQVFRDLGSFTDPAVVSEKQIVPVDGDGPVRLAVVVVPGTVCQRGIRASAARTARSDQEKRGFELLRRSTASSCRKTSISASFDADDRASRASHDSTWIKSR